MKNSKASAFPPNPATETTDKTDHRWYHSLLSMVTLWALLLVVGTSTIQSITASWAQAKIDRSNASGELAELAAVHFNIWESIIRTWRQDTHRLVSKHIVKLGLIDKIAAEDYSSVQADLDATFAETADQDTYTNWLILDHNGLVRASVDHSPATPVAEPFKIGGLDIRGVQYRLTISDDLGNPTSITPLYKVTSSEQIGWIVIQANLRGLAHKLRSFVQRPVFVKQLDGTLLFANSADEKKFKHLENLGSGDVFTMGGRQLRSYRSTTHSGLEIYIAHDITDYLAGVQAIQRWSLLFGFGFSAMLLVAGLFYFRYRFRPLRQLTESMSVNVISGKSPLPTIEVTGQDEISLLSSAFSTMSKKLRDSVFYLEDRVRMRTRRLELSAELGEQLNSHLDRLEIIAEVMNLLTRDSNSRQAYLLEPDPKTQELKVVASSRNATQLAAPIANSGIITAAYKSGELQSPSLAQYRSNSTSEVQLALPIVRADIVRGVLYIKQDEPLEPTAASFLKSLTNQMSIALSNAELFQAVQKESQVKGDFLANVSHEIRTPLNGILGMTKLVLDSTLNEDQREHLKLAQESAQGLLIVVNDVLDFSLLGSGELKIHNLAFDPQKIVRDTVATQQPLAARKNLLLSCEIAQKRPLRVLGDPDRLRQVLINLITNAIKFTSAGKVSVSLKTETLGQDQVRLLISVKDTGIGIAKEKQKEIFTEFSQADNSATRRFGGAGLGLSICRELMLRMNGSISLSSEFGHGSTFVAELTCPAVSSRNPLANSRPSANSEELEGLKLLLVEDNLINQKLATRMLQKRGAAVHLADNGQVCLDLLANDDFDAILMDLQMPIMGGLETTERIRRGDIPGKESIPIIAITANAMAGDREHCIALGMNDYFSKPIDFSALCTKIHEILVLQT